jgi:hypothetical protein
VERPEPEDPARARWFDAWLSPPEAELLVGLALFLLSWEWFWETVGAIWDNWHNIVGTTEDRLRRP